MTIIKTNRQKENSMTFQAKIIVCLFAGQSNCGKTNLLMHILRKPLVYYDEIYYIGHNPHQEKNTRFYNIDE